MIPHFSSLSQWRKIQDYSDHTRVVENEKDKISEGKDYCHPGVLLDALSRARKDKSTDACVEECNDCS